MATIIATSKKESISSVLVRDLKSGEVAKNGGDSTESIDKKYAALDERLSTMAHEGKNVELINEVLGTDSLYFGEEKDILSRFYILMHFCQKMEGKPEFETSLQSALDSLTSSQDKAAMKTQILAAIYHVFGTNSLGGYLIFKTILSYGAKNQFYKAILPHTENVTDLMNNWPVSNAQKRELYAVAINIMKTHDTVQNQLYTYLNEYLSLVQEENNDALYNAEETKEFAKLCAVTAISLPSLIQIDELFELQAIQNLEKDAKLKKLFELLKIFQEKMLEDYTKWSGANKAFLTEVGLKEEECVEKMRLLTLCSVTANKNLITYKEIADALKISEEEVELWVVDAIANNHINAKIDQLSGTIALSHTTSRNFGEEEWKNLKQHIQVWKSKISSMKEVMHRNQEQAAQQ